jgi:hypothetical protein
VPAREREQAREQARERAQVRAPARAPEQVREPAPEPPAAGCRVDAATDWNFTALAAVFDDTYDQRPTPPATPIRAAAESFAVACQAGLVAPWAQARARSPTVPVPVAWNSRLIAVPGAMPLAIATSVARLVCVAVLPLTRVMPSITTPAGVTRTADW